MFYCDSDEVWLPLYLPVNKRLLYIGYGQVKMAKIVRDSRYLDKTCSFGGSGAATDMEDIFTNCVYKADDVFRGIILTRGLLFIRRVHFKRQRYLQDIVYPFQHIDPQLYGASAISKMYDMFDNINNASNQSHSPGIVWPYFFMGLSQDKDTLITPEIARSMMNSTSRHEFSMLQDERIICATTFSSNSDWDAENKLELSLIKAGVANDLKDTKFFPNPPTMPVEISNRSSYRSRCEIEWKPHTLWRSEIDKRVKDAIKQLDFQLNDCDSQCFDMDSDHTAMECLMSNNRNEYATPSQFTNPINAIRDVIPGILDGESYNRKPTKLNNDVDTTDEGKLKQKESVANEDVDEVEDVQSSVHNVVPDNVEVKEIQSSFHNVVPDICKLDRNTKHNSSCLAERSILGSFHGEDYREILVNVEFGQLLLPDPTSLKEDHQVKVSHMLQDGYCVSHGVITVYIRPDKIEQFRNSLTMSKAIPSFVGQTRLARSFRIVDGRYRTVHLERMLKQRTMRTPLVLTVSLLIRKDWKMMEMEELSIYSVRKHTAYNIPKYYDDRTVLKLSNAVAELLLRKINSINLVRIINLQREIQQTLLLREKPLSYFRPFAIISQACAGKKEKKNLVEHSFERCRYLKVTHLAYSTMLHSSVKTLGWFCSAVISGLNRSKVKQEDVKQRSILITRKSIESLLIPRITHFSVLMGKLYEQASLTMNEIGNIVMDDFTVVSSTGITVEQHITNIINDWYLEELPFVGPDALFDGLSALIGRVIADNDNLADADNGFLQSMLQEQRRIGYLPVLKLRKREALSKKKVVSNDRKYVSNASKRRKQRITYSTESSEEYHSDEIAEQTDNGDAESKNVKKRVGKCVGQSAENTAQSSSSEYDSDNITNETNEEVVTAQDEDVLTVSTEVPNMGCMTNDSEKALTVSNDVSNASPLLTRRRKAKVYKESDFAVPGKLKLFVHGTPEPDKIPLRKPWNNRLGIFDKMELSRNVVQRCCGEVQKLMVPKTMWVRSTLYHENLSNWLTFVHIPQHHRARDICDFDMVEAVHDEFFTRCYVNSELRNCISLPTCDGSGSAAVKDAIALHYLSKKKNDFQTKGWTIFAGFSEEIELDGTIYDKFSMGDIEDFYQCIPMNYAPEKGKVIWEVVRSSGDDDLQALADKGEGRMMTSRYAMMEFLEAQDTGVCLWRKRAILDLCLGFMARLIGVQHGEEVAMLNTGGRLLKNHKRTPHQHVHTDLTMSEDAECLSEDYGGAFAMVSGQEGFHLWIASESHLFLAASDALTYSKGKVLIEKLWIPARSILFVRGYIPHAGLGSDGTSGRGNMRYHITFATKRSLLADHIHYLDKDTIHYKS